MILTNTKILILAGLIATGLPVLASSATPVNGGYLADSAGNLVKNGHGGCWHTGYWTPEMAISECDPVAAKAEVKQPPKVSATSPAPQPQPKLAPVQAKAVLQKINLSEEDLFKFNKAVLKPTGKAKLDNLVRELNGVKYEVIHVAGHTDRIGSAKYNMRLSKRRADVVKSYLVNKGIPADRIDAVGMGKAEPVTKLTDCRGMTRARTIACLQPDRRAEVTVIGTREDVENQKLTRSVNQ